MNRTGLLSALALFALAGVCGAAIINVPDDQQTIQAGIDASEDGDTVLVQPGIYYENLRISNRDLLLASLYLTTGREVYLPTTIIDGNESGSVIYLGSGAERNFTLIGFTIRNGENYRGGGIYFASYNVVVEHCLIRGNHCSGDRGGGICNLWDGSLKLSYCTFDSNESSFYGGAVYAHLSMVADHCVFSYNRAYGYGGAVHLTCCPGGTFTNCVFFNNSAPNGGAIQLETATAVLDRCTIANNQNNDSLGGIQLLYGSKVILNNSIVWGNEGDQIACDNGYYRNTVSVSYSDVQGGEEGIHQDNGEALILWNDGNIDADPLFANPNNGNFGLQSGSPCIDTGDPEAEPDPDGSRADMGALPYTGRVVIRGFVYDSLTDQPVIGVWVGLPEFPSIFAITDSIGFYLIADAREEYDFSLLATSSGYADSTVAGFRLNENDTLDWDFHLLHPVFTPSEGEVVREVVVNDSAIVQLTLGNSGNYPLQWFVRREMPDEPEPWSLKRSYYISRLTGNGSIEGVALADGNFYIAGSGADTNYIYVVDLDGQLVDIFQLPGEDRLGMNDLAWDGELLWGSIGWNIFGFTTEGEMSSLFEGPYQTNLALAWDTDYDLLWVSSDSSNEITGCNRNGNQLVELVQPGFRIYGLAYWAGDPDGYQLYIFHSPDGERQVVHKMNTDSGDTMFVRNLEPEEGGSPRGCEIAGDYEPFTDVFLSVANNGDDDRVDVWYLDSDPTFLRFTPSEGLIDWGASQDMELTLSSVGLGQGFYNAELIFTFPEVRSGAAIPVTMRVKPNSISDLGFRIAEFGLGEAYPNPFNSSLAASYQLSAVSPVKLHIYDISGRQVQTIDQGWQPAGEHRAVIDGSGLASGVYLLKLAAGENMATRKIVCVK